MPLLSVALCGVLALSGAICLNHIAITALFNLRRRRRHGNAGPAPFVSIMKPVRGFDDEIRENLQSFFELDYPSYEILIGVEPDDAPAYADMISALSSRYPQVAVRQVVVAVPPGTNPKICLLAALERGSRGELIWTTDANVRVERDHLRHLVSDMAAARADLVFSPPRAQGGRSCASMMEMSHVNALYAPNILSLWRYFGLSRTIGKSLLMQRSALAAVGGFERFSCYIAEDIRLGDEFAARGFTLTCSGEWATFRTVHTTVAGLWHDMVRWTTTRYHMRTGACYFLDILFNPVGIAGIALLCGVPHAAGCLAVAVIGKSMYEYLMLTLVAPEDAARFRACALIAPCAIGKDLVYGAMLFLPLFSASVTWRGRRVRIGKHSAIVPVAGACGSTDNRQRPGLTDPRKDADTHASHPVFPTRP